MKTGMAGGCISGAALGAAMGSIPGAMLGGMLGTAAGTFLDDYYARKALNEDDELSRRKLKEDEQKLVIRDSSVNPQQVATGGEATTHIQYSVLGPPESDAIEIKEKRDLFTKKEGTTPLSEKTVSRSQGTHRSSLTVKIPGSISRGDAVLITTISYGAQQATVQTPLKIL
ncbi:MAG: hypothetical protein RDU01_01840 [Thermodesulfovibrionales bacterium]|nr:hypothetical protein [Thermodesulfovibrionales bacterium]